MSITISNSGALMALGVTASLGVYSVAKLALRGWMVRHGGGPVQARPALDQRMERVERAVDAITLEVERIAEGQRFAARLLEERSPIAPLASTPPRMNTPH